MMLSDLESTCSVTVPSGGGASLPVTGVDTVPLLGVLVVAAALIVVGLLLAGGRSRRGVSTALAVVVVAAAALAAAPAPAAYATSAQSSPCALIGIESVVRTPVQDLLPGGQAQSVQFTVRNTAASPVEVTVDTMVREGADLTGSDLRVQIIGTSGTNVAGALHRAPTTPAVTLSPGESTTFTYLLSLPPDTGDTAQGIALSYDSIVTATQH